MRLQTLILVCILMPLAWGPVMGQTGKPFMALNDQDAPPWAKGTPDSDCTEATQTGCIDWKLGYAIAIGFGKAPNRMMAERIAQVVAYRKLLEMIKGVNLTSETTVNGATLENDTIRTQIAGRLQGLVPVDKTRYYSDGSLAVKYRASIYKIIPQSAYIKDSGAPRQHEPPATPPVSSSPLNTGGLFTGLVIDARGTGVNPAMSPKVYDPEGHEVYGSAFVSREFVATHGMVGYVKSVEAARKTDRVKGNPVVIKAVGARGANKADLIISQVDADALRAVSKKHAFLRESRVMVVLD